MFDCQLVRVHLPWVCL